LLHGTGPSLRPDIHTPRRPAWHQSLCCASTPVRYLTQAAAHPHTAALSPYRPNCRRIGRRQAGHGCCSRYRPHLVEHIRDFDHFIRWKPDPERPCQFHIDTSIQSQLDYLVDLQGKLLVDYIGHYESLQQDFAHVCKTIGTGHLHLPHKRRATDRRQDFRSYYSEELAALVGDYFKRDIEALDYRFES
jgi:hypothetical protein